MGYRSEVAIKCQENAFKMFQAADGAIGYDKLLKCDDEYMMIWEWIVWYDYEPGIREIMEVMDKLAELEPEIIKEKKLGYAFLRLGEDAGDYEYLGNSDAINLSYIYKIDTEDFEEVKGADNG